MLRLGLNVASTRVVLLEGHTGGDAAGQVIEAFGAFVIGGNYVVGFIVFSILMIIRGGRALYPRCHAWTPNGH
jgi:flagellar biosynthesis protein FlhA